MVKQNLDSILSTLPDRAAQIAKIRSHAGHKLPADVLGQVAEELLAAAQLDPAAGERLFAPKGWTDICKIRQFTENFYEPNYYCVDDREQFMRFAGINFEQASKMLTHIPVAALADRQNNGPSLETCLQLAVKFPDLIYLAGYLVGQVRWDERISIDTIFVKDTEEEIFTSQTRPGEIWSVLQAALEFSAEQLPPDDIYYSHPTWARGNGGWCLWWD